MIPMWSIGSEAGQFCVLRIQGSSEVVEVSTKLRCTVGALVENIGSKFRLGLEFLNHSGTITARISSFVPTPLAISDSIRKVSSDRESVNFVNGGQLEGRSITPYEFRGA
jgi:hypothetical protein